MDFIRILLACLGILGSACNNKSVSSVPPPSSNTGGGANATGSCSSVPSSLVSVPQSLVDPTGLALTGFSVQPVDYGAYQSNAFQFTAPDGASSMFWRGCWGGSNAGCYPASATTWYKPSYGDTELIPVAQFEGEQVTFSARACNSLSNTLPNVIQNAKEYWICTGSSCVYSQGRPQNVRVNPGSEIYLCGPQAQTQASIPANGQDAASKQIASLLTQISQLSDNDLSTAATSVVSSANAYLASGAAGGPQGLLDTQIPSSNGAPLNPVVATLMRNYANMGSSVVQGLLNNEWNQRVNDVQSYIANGAQVSSSSLALLDANSGCGSGTDGSTNSSIFDPSSILGGTNALNPTAAGGNSSSSGHSTGGTGAMGGGGTTDTGNVTTTGTNSDTTGLGSAGSVSSTSNPTALRAVLITLSGLAFLKTAHGIFQAVHGGQIWQKDFWARREMKNAMRQVIAGNGKGLDEVNKAIADLAAVNEDFKKSVLDKQGAMGIAKFQNGQIVLVSSSAEAAPVAAPTAPVDLVSEFNAIADEYKTKDLRPGSDDLTSLKGALTAQLDSLGVDQLNNNKIRAAINSIEGDAHGTITDLANVESKLRAVVVPEPKIATPAKADVMGTLSAGKGYSKEISVTRTDGSPSSKVGEHSTGVVGIVGSAVVGGAAAWFASKTQTSLLDQTLPANLSKLYSNFDTIGAKISRINQKIDDLNNQLSTILGQTAH